MDNPGYYRDIIKKILNESADEIPVPPSRADIKAKQFLNRVHINKLKVLVEINERNTRPTFYIKGLNIPLPDGHFVSSINIECGSDFGDLGVTPPYTDDSMPDSLHNYKEAHAIEQRVEYFLAGLGFHVEINLGTEDMHKHHALLFLHETSPETEAVWTAITKISNPYRSF